MGEVSKWIGFTAMTMGLSCSGTTDPVSSGAGTHDEKEINTVSQPVYGGNTTVNNTQTFDAIGATAALNINGTPFACTGVLVTPTKVLTAAHCFQCANWFVAANNSVTFAQVPPATYQSGLAAPPALHPNAPGCNAPGAFDVAIVTLSTPVPPSVAQPIPMLLHGDPNQPLNDQSLTQPCSVVGHGGNVIFSSSAGFGPRRVGNLIPSWYRDQCGDACEGPCYDDFVWRTDLSPSHAVTASGDSGGGVFCTMNGNNSVVLGVSSGWSTFSAFCNTEQNSIWAGLANVADWIIPQLALPNVTPLSDLALYAKGVLRVNDRARIVQQSGVGAKVAGGSGSRLGVESRVGPAWINGSVEIADRARVDGALVAGGNVAPGPGATITGGSTEYRYSQLPDFSLPVVYPTQSAAPINLAPGQIFNLAPSNLFIPAVTVNVGARLNLACNARYFFGNLVSEGSVTNAGFIVVDTSCGPTRIFVRDYVNLKGTLTDAHTAVEGDVLLGYTGTHEVFTSLITATIVAPNAKVSVQPPATQLSGAIFAGLIEVHQDVLMSHRPFPTVFWL